MIINLLKGIPHHKKYNSNKAKLVLIITSLSMILAGCNPSSEPEELNAESTTLANAVSDEEEQERLEHEEQERKDQEEQERKDQEEQERKDQEEQERKDQEEQERLEHEEQERKDQEEQERLEQELQKATSNIPNSIVASVVSVVDGDTIIVSINGHEERVRFLLVDTPETVHPNKPVEPFGPEASNFVKSRLEGKEVILQRDVSERDRYSRLLYYVYDIEGNSIQEELLERGLARVSVYPPDVKYVDHYREIQSEAQRKALGIWSIENYAQDSQQPSQNSSSNSTPPPSTNTESNSGKGLIKGNISSSGEKIYHVPGGAFYDRTIIDEAAGERWFHTESEAIEAGWRKSKR